MSRFLVKMSGEAIADVDGESFLDVGRLEAFASQVASAQEADNSLRVAIVVGGGNILRGKSLDGVNRTKADHMGMLATVINSLALQDALRTFGIDSRVMTGIEIPKVAEPFILGRAMKHLDRGRAAIFAGGTGNPFFTTDTASALRASEIEADCLLLAKFGTDGVYDKDPNEFPEAKRFDSIRYEEIIARDLQVMDHTAVTLCRDAEVPIFVFDMNAEDAVRRALLGDRSFGTMIENA
jgi:uridylate kinase